MKFLSYGEAHLTIVGNVVIYLYEYYCPSLPLISIKTVISFAFKTADVTIPEGSKMDANKLSMCRLVLGRFFGE